MAEPVLTFTYSASIISAKTGYDVVTVTFSSDIAYQKFECRATKEGQTFGPGVGALLAYFGYTPAKTNRTFEIYDEHLTAGDGKYRISLYAETATNGYYIPLNSDKLITKDRNIFLSKGVT